MKIWLVRHAKPLVEKGLCYGRLDVKADQTLTELASDNLMNALSERSGIKVLLTSPRRRTKQLANLLAQRLNINLVEEERLAEMDFGEWEGRTYDAIDAEDGPRWRQWCENWQTMAPPGGEALDVFSARIVNWLETQTLTPNDAIVTHAGVIRTCRVLSGASWEEAMASENPFLGWTQHSLAALDQ